MRNILRCSLLFLAMAALLTGCSDSNSDAPTDVHPDITVWYQQHRTATTLATFVDDCGGCHVVNGPAPGVVPPSCFSSSFRGLSCHADGPGNAPHPLTDAFLNGGHGKLAKADLTFCQKCHSNNPNGGPGSNPVFNVGISAGPNGGGGCEQCHPAGAAHPVPWAGPGTAAAPNTVFHYSAGNIQAACTLCHGTNLDGAASVGVGPSCQTCHAETTNFTLDCTACHGFPPSGTVGTKVSGEGGVLVDHTTPVTVPLSSHDQCGVCHGVKNSDSSSTGTLNARGNYKLFDKATDTIGDHWNGNINMNDDTGYDQNTFTCSFNCHSTATPHALPNSSNLPVQLGNYGVTSPGSNPPHPLGDQWLLKSQHSTYAVNVTINCFNCHETASGGISPPCQACHQVNPILDPATALTNGGCASCHNYPPDGTTPVTTQPNRAGKHGEHFPAFTSDCNTCHNGIGTETTAHANQSRTNPPVDPATLSIQTVYNAKSGTALYDNAGQTCSSVSCHGGQTTPNWYTGSLPDPASATTANDYCWSCHAFGTSEYNSYNSGEHDFHVNSINKLCTECHDTTVLQNGVAGRPIGVVSILRPLS